MDSFRRHRLPKLPAVSSAHRLAACHRGHQNARSLAVFRRVHFVADVLFSQPLLAPNLFVPGAGRRLGADCAAQPRRFSPVSEGAAGRKRAGDVPHGGLPGGMGNVPARSRSPDGAASRCRPNYPAGSVSSIKSSSIFHNTYLEILVQYGVIGLALYGMADRRSFSSGPETAGRTFPSGQFPGRTIPLLMAVDRHGLSGERLFRGNELSIRERHLVHAGGHAGSTESS